MPFPVLFHVIHWPIIYVTAGILNLHLPRNLPAFPRARNDPSTPFFQRTLPMKGIFLEFPLVLGSVLETDEAVGSDAVSVLSEKVFAGLILDLSIAMKLVIFPLTLYSISIDIFDLFEGEFLEVDFFFNGFFDEGDFPF